MKKAFCCASLMLASVLLTACVSLAQERFADESYPASIVASEETARGAIFYGSKNEHPAENNLNIRIKNGAGYPVSNPLLALDGITAEGGALNVFFNFFSGDDGNFTKKHYKAYITIDGAEQKVKQSILIYEDNRGRQYIKRSFTVSGISYKFQNSFSNLFAAYPYMFCEFADGSSTYKVFAVSEAAHSEMQFIKQGICNESQEYVILLNDAVAARFTRKGYTLYEKDSQSTLKRSIALISSIFAFIEEHESTFF